MDGALLTPNLIAQLGTSGIFLVLAKIVWDKMWKMMTDKDKQIREQNIELKGLLVRVTESMEKVNISSERNILLSERVLNRFDEVMRGK